MAITHDFANLTGYRRLTGRMIAQAFISDSSDDAIDYIDVRLQRTTEIPLGDAYAAILEENENGTPGKAIAISEGVAAAAITTGGGTVRFTFNADNTVPVSTAMFFAIIHDGPTAYTDEVAENNNLITNGALVWSGSDLPNWEIVESPPNSTVTDASPGVELDKALGSETILPTIIQRDLFETGRSYEAQIIVDESIRSEYARMRLIVKTTENGGVEWMEDPYGAGETLCRIRFIAEGPDFYLSVNDGAASVTVDQIFTDVAVYPLDGEFQRTVSLGLDDSLPVFSGGLWAKEPGVPWAENLNESLVFEVAFQSSVPGETILSQINALNWNLTFPANSGDMDNVLTTIKNVFTRWELQREKIVQVDREAKPGQANWESSWLFQGETLPIPDGTRLFWRQPSQGFSGQWEARNGSAHRKDRYNRGTSEYYITAVEVENFFEVDELVNTPRKGNWWVDDDNGGGPFVQPSEFTFTLHRAAYLRVNKTRLRDLGANTVTDSFYYTVDGHHIIARSAMDDQNEPDGLRWVPQGRGLNRDVESGDKSLILVSEFMHPLFLPPGKHRIRYGWTLGSDTDAGATIDRANSIFISPYVVSDVVQYDYPDYWEFIYV